MRERPLWELEPHGHLLAPNALPDPAWGDAMPSEDFDTLLRAARWTALSLIWMRMAVSRLAAPSHLFYVEHEQVLDGEHDQLT